MNKIIEKLNKLSLPATIIIASLILGGFYYASQINKQKSIEKQQEIKLQNEKQQQEVKLQDEKRQQETKNALEDLKLKQDECKSLSVGVTKKWNNVIGVTYDNDFWKQCVVTYTDHETGEIKKTPLKLMSEATEKQ
jgi:uncharacterized membrane protein YciS (DUF1049 family)